MQVKWLVLTLYIIMSRLVQTAESLADYRAVGKFVFINTGWRKYCYRDITSGQSRSLLQQYRAIKRRKEEFYLPMYR